MARRTAGLAQFCGGSHKARRDYRILGGGNSTVESHSSKVMVAGSNPVPRSKFLVDDGDSKNAKASRITRINESSTKNVEFVENRQCFGDDGGLRAQSAYVFRVSGNNVTVLVNWDSVRTLDGNRLSQDEIILAGQTLIKMEIQNNVDLTNTGTEIVLNNGAMFHISGRLGWRKRFYKEVTA